jgi:thiamine kinase-like enzyme
MSDAIENRLRENLLAIPSLAGYTGAVERLGGLTNLVFQLGDVCLRLPGAGTEEYINRAHEAEAAKGAADSGVSPEVLYFDPETGVMASRFIHNATTMTPAGFRADMGAVRRAGQAFRQLHTSDAVFPFTFELFSMIDDYLGILATKDVALPEGYHDVVSEAEAVRKALAAQSRAALVACHCDPLCENFLDAGRAHVDRRLGIFRHERSDVGLRRSLGRRRVSRRRRMKKCLTAYFGGEATPQIAPAWSSTRPCAICLWTLWGLIQLANNNPAEDFRAYADGRFARCRSLMASPEFSNSLVTLKSGNN